MKRFKRKSWHGSLYKPNNWELMEAEGMGKVKRAFYLWNPYAIGVRVRGGLWERRNVTECPY